MRRYHAVHLGMATQTPNGLVVPVIRDAQDRDLWGLAAEIARLAEATRKGTATRDELSGSTLTLTSLGPLGGLAHTPVINHPEVAIVGPNKIVDRPVVLNGQVVVRKMMNLSSSFDHRVVDGYDAAEFIQALKGIAGASRHPVHAGLTGKEPAPAVAVLFRRETTPAAIIRRKQRGGHAWDYPHNHFDPGLAGRIADLGP